MRNQRRSLIFVLLALSCVPQTARHACAQDESGRGNEPATATTQTPEFPHNLQAMLDKVAYDDSDTAIIVVNPVRWITPASGLPAGRVRLPAIGLSAGLRIASAGGIRCLIAPQMTVLNTNPGPANIFAGMQPGEVLEQLLATLSPGQWQTVSSPAGIGLDDLNDDQKLLFAQIFPTDVGVVKSTLQPGLEPNEWDQVNPETLPATDRKSLRVRLNKEVSFQVSDRGKDLSTEYWSLAHPDYERSPGTVVYRLYDVNSPDADDAELKASRVFGVPVLLKVPNILKPSAIDYSAPNFDAPVWLTFRQAPLPSSLAESAIASEMPAHFPPKLTEAMLAALPAASRASTAAAFEQVRTEAAATAADRSVLPTVGDLLQRVSAATHLTFAADRRIRDLPVFLRGQSTRSGDLLQALAHSAAGAFRKIDGVNGEPPIFLLTDDIEGIGARAGRIGEWADAADEKKRSLAASMATRASRSKPLEHLTFAPDDKYALSNSMTTAVEAGWKDGHYQSDIQSNRADLPDNLQKGLQAFIDQGNDPRGSLRYTSPYSTKRVQITESLCAYVVVPGIGAIRAGGPTGGLNWAISQQFYFTRIACDQDKRAALRASARKAADPLPPSGFAPALKRRILIASVASADEASAVVRTAANRGLSDIWLQVSLADPAASSAVLKAGVEAGKGSIAVGTAVALLKSSGLPEVPEQNILGETMDAFVTRRLKELAGDESFTYYQSRYDAYRHWTVGGTDAMAASIAKIAQTSGLSAVTFRAPTPPGANALREGVYDIATNAETGYTVDRRRAFLNMNGIDPIDIPDAPIYANVVWTHGLFASATRGDDEYHINSTQEDAPLRRTWWEFRGRENRDFLTSLYASLRKQQATLPLFIDDRHAAYYDSSHKWFGSWDAATKLPEDPMSGLGAESDALAAARTTSHTVLGDWKWGSDDNAKADSPARFARGVSEDSKRFIAPKYDGMVIDLAELSAVDALRALAALPPAAANGVR